MPHLDLPVLRLVRLALGLVLATTASASALDYRIAVLDDGRCGFQRNCPLAIMATANIEKDEVQNFIAFLKAEAASRTRMPRDLVIHSGGGYLIGGMRLGLAARKLQLRTVAGRVVGGEIRPGLCASACVFTLMGGRTRYVPQGSHVVVHAPWEGTSDNQQALTPEVGRSVRDLLSRYTRNLGVSPGVVGLIMSVPHDSNRRLTANELSRFKLATQQ